MGGRVALIHVLYALCRGLRAGGIEVYLQVIDRLKGHAKLQVLGAVSGRRGGHTVVGKQPATLTGTVYVAVSNETEGKVESRRECVTTPLSEGLADNRHETGQRHGVLVAVGDAEGARRHEHTGHTLGRLVPSLVVKGLLGGDGELHPDGRVGLVEDLYLVGIHLFPAH